MLLHIYMYFIMLFLIFYECNHNQIFELSLVSKFI
jgi:hypothetical protein